MGTEMKMLLERTWCGPVCTIGTLSVDGKTECFVLEDVVRGGADPATVAQWKIHGKSAIPKGTYKVIIAYSPHFDCDLPLLRGVPGFDGIRIHPGNVAADTEGCLLVGRTKMHDFVGESRAAFVELEAKIDAALDAGEDVTIEIR